MAIEFMVTVSDLTTLRQVVGLSEHKVRLELKALGYTVSEWLLKRKLAGQWPIYPDEVPLLLEVINTRGRVRINLTMDQLLSVIPLLKMSRRRGVIDIAPGVPEHVVKAYAAQLEHAKRYQAKLRVRMKARREAFRANRGE